MPTYDRVQRRLIVCCDGTWQSSISGERNIPSNVTRMCRHLGRSQVVQENGETVLYNQMVFYDPGIGTGDLTAADVSLQGGTGAGLAQNVIECYNWLVLNWQPGDKVYTFGFSRGAYTARSLAGFIAELGICSPTDMIWFPLIYDLYEGALYPAKDTDTADIKKARADFEALREKWMGGESLTFHLGDKSQKQDLQLNTGPRKVIPQASRQLEVVGVWDTVGSLGIPKLAGFIKLPSLPWSILAKPGRSFHDVRLSDNVRHAFHALALDERRAPFSPTLWYVPKGSTRPDDLTFKQCWFPGVHINCGGGSDDILNQKKSDCEQIANVTFCWMVEQVRPYLAFDDASIAKSMQDQQALLKVLYNNYKDTWAVSGWANGDIVDSFTGIMLAAGSQRRSPGETMQPEDLTDKTEQRTTKLGTTNELIHPCVFWRMQQNKTRSPALGKFKRQRCSDPKQGWEWVAKGEDGTPIHLPEYHIMPHDADSSKPRNTERLLAEVNGVKDYLVKLDKMYDTGVDLTPPDEGFTKLAA